MKTIMDISAPKPFFRMISILSFLPILFFINFLYFLFTDQITTKLITIFLYLNFFGLLLSFIVNYNKLRFYIIKIVVNENEEFIFKYYEWFKMREIILPNSDIRFYLEQVVSWRLRIAIKKKTLIKQYENPWWSSGFWMRKNLAEVYNKMRIELS